MSTHMVEIRYKNTTTIDMPWQPLTWKPCSLDEAQKLVTMVGQKWETRIIPIARKTVWTKGEERALLILAALPDQLDLYDRSEFSDDQVKDIARNHLFAPFENPVSIPGADRPKRWRKFEVTHDQGCTTRVCKWSSCKSDDLSGGQWHARRMMVAATTLVHARALDLGLNVEVLLGDPLVHSGHCPECGATVTGMSIKLELVWGPHRMVREYEVS